MEFVEEGVGEPAQLQFSPDWMWLATSGLIELLLEPDRQVGGETDTSQNLGGVSDEPLKNRAV